MFGREHAILGRKQRAGAAKHGDEEAVRVGAIGARTGTQRPRCMSPSLAIGKYCQSGYPP
jgi:hypothetical protein